MDGSVHSVVRVESLNPYAHHRRKDIARRADYAVMPQYSLVTAYIIQCLPTLLENKIYIFRRLDCIHAIVAAVSALLSSEWRNGGH